VRADRGVLDCSAAKGEVSRRLRTRGKQMIDQNRQLLNSHLVDVESAARAEAFGLGNHVLKHFPAEQLVENFLQEYMVELAEVNLSAIGMSMKTEPTFATPTSTQIGLKLLADCNESARYLGDLSKIMVRGNTKEGYQLHGFFWASTREQAVESLPAYKAEFMDAIEADLRECNALISEHRERMAKDVRHIITEQQADLGVVGQAAEAMGLRSGQLPAVITIPLEPKSLNLESVKTRRGAGAPVAVLADEIADQLVRTLRSFAIALERQPVLTDVMLERTEEPLRDMLLFILNAQWGGAVTAETFSKEGKTDILLRWEEANAFISECKVWKGAVEFAKGIDQLLRYTVWRDTRVGLILFIRGVLDVKGIIAKAEECIINHPNFVELGKGEHEFVIHSNDDDKQHIRLALIPIHIAASASLSSRPLHKATVAE